MDAKVVVDAQDARVSTLPRSLTDDYRRRLGELLELDPKEKERLKKWLKDRIKDWMQDTSDLHRRLEEDNDLVEGVVMETDFPWEGASNVHVPVTEIYMEIYKSVFKRSILGADMIWYGETDDDILKELLPEVEEMLNYKARHEWNIAECLEDVFWTTPRDGLTAVQATWREEYEPARDVVLLTSVDDFLKEFPTPADAGLELDEYIELGSYVEANASEELPVEVPITFEKQTYYGCFGEVVELVDFVTFPATVKDIKDPKCRGYGKRFSERRGTIRQKARDKVFYEDVANRLLSKSHKDAVTAYVQAKDEIEGLSRSNDKDNFTLFELVVRGRLKGKDDQAERKFLVTYSYDHDELLAAMEYPYRVDFYALFRINKRPNRLIGKSIPQKTRDMNDEIDTQHNQRINTRTVGTVPSFKAQASLKKELDPMLKENRWRPGVTFWLTNFESFEQFKVQPTDLGESMSEENNDMKILDLHLGSAASLLSGGAPSGDPSAPGNKTAMMIQQSNLRMDDPLSELRQGVKDLGEICLSHIYQFGPAILEYQSDIETKAGLRSETKTLHKRFLRRGIRLNMSGITVTNNAESEMAKQLQLYGVLMQEPVFQQNPQARLEVLRDALRMGRVPGRKRYLPTLEEVQQQQVQIQKQAMIQLQQEQQAAAQEQAAAAAKQRLAQAGQEEKIRSLAQKTAERSLGQADSAVNGGAS